MQIHFKTPQCISGPGSSLSLGELVSGSGYKKVLFICDQGVISAGITEPVITALVASGVKVTVFDEVIPDPSAETAEAAGQRARESGADAIVAIGGGSSIDTAKAASLLAANKEPIQNFYSRNIPMAKPLPLFAVPTTSGTGSEVTPAAVISDKELKRKVTLVDPKLMPEFAILDPLLTLGLPRGLTAATGMDALAHAVESMTCILHNPLTDGIALSAAGLIMENLPICVENGRDENARTNMQLASAMAGMAFGNTAAHVGHAFAHAMGAVWHIPHGTACALALPFAILNCGASAYSRILALSRAAGIPTDGVSNEEITRRLSRWFMDFARSVGIPSLRELNVTPSDLDRIVDATLNEKPLIQLSGVPVTDSACREWYKELFRM